MRAKQWLIVFEQHLVDLKNIILSVDKKKRHNNIEFLAVGKGVSRFFQQSIGFFQCQFQCDGKGENGTFSGYVAISLADFGKELPLIQQF